MAVRFLPRLSAGGWALVGFGGLVAAALTATALSAPDPGALLASRWGAITAFVEARPLLAAAGFVGLYVLATLLLLPGVLWLTLGAGAAFGAPLAAALTWLAALTGSTALFILARSAIGGRLARRATGWAALLRDGFQRDAFRYLLSLRLLPFAPYFAVNLAPALLGVRLSTFVGATALGMIPGIVIYSVVGAGLGATFAAGGRVDLALAARPEAGVALAVLAALASAPALIRFLRRE